VLSWDAGSILGGQLAGNGIDKGGDRWRHQLVAAFAA
jgi:hypothetical protein